jgi:hypothetical protein
VGQTERNYYDEEGFTKFEQGLRGTLKVAFENEKLTIYEVVDGEGVRAQGQ